MTRMMLDLTLRSHTESLGALADAATPAPAPTAHVEGMVAEPKVIAETLRAVADQIDPRRTHR